MSGYGPDWSGLKQLKVIPKSEKTVFILTLPDVDEEKFTADLYYTTGPGYGNWEIQYENELVGKIDGFAKELTVDA